MGNRKGIECHMNTNKLHTPACYVSHSLTLPSIHAPVAFVTFALTIDLFLACNICGIASVCVRLSSGDSDDGGGGESDRSISGAGGDPSR